MIKILLTNAAYLIAKKFFAHDINNIRLTLQNNSHRIGLVNDNLLPILVAAEDSRFYKHCGFDIISIFGALISTLRDGKLRGASTIDQQLVRTITQKVNYSYRRKIKEILLAAAVNNFLSKRNIGKAYICLAYYGWQMSGFQACLDRLKRENIVAQCDTDYAVIAMLRYPLPKSFSETRILQINNRIRYIKLRMS